MAFLKYRRVRATRDKLASYVMEDRFSDTEEEEGDYIPPVPEHFDYLFKIMLIGDSGVGKTCVVTRFIDGDLPNGAVAVTGGIVFKHVVFNVNTKAVKFQLWDSAGQDRFRCLMKMHFKNKDAFVLFYDVSKRSSFDNVVVWMNELTQDVEKPLVYLVANKCDYDADQRRVSKEEGEKLAADLKVPYFETSARTACNVGLLFQKIANTLIARSGNG